MLALREKLALEIQYRSRHIMNMPNRSSIWPPEANAPTRSDTDAVTVEPRITRSQKNPAAVELGRLGGRKGGRARALILSAKQRSEIARKAAKARWKRHGSDSSR